MVNGISPDNEAFLQQAVAAGQFPSREAALDEAVRALREKTEPVKAVSGKESDGKRMSAEEWINDLRAWSASHPYSTHFVDDSRESIYEGRGE